MHRLFYLLQRITLSAAVLAIICQGLLLSPVLADDDTLQDHITAANEYMDAKQWDYANFEWREAIRLDPVNAVAHRGLAKSLMESGFNKEAIAHLRSVQGTVQKASIDVLLAEALAIENRPNEAANTYLAVLKKVNFHDEAFEGLYRLQGKLAPKEREAVAMFLKKRATDGREKAQQAIEKEQYRTAANYLKLATVYFKQPDIQNNYGVSLLLSGQYKEAATLYKRLLSQYDYWKLHSNNAIAMLALNQPYAARKSIEEAIRLCDSDARKGQLYNNLGYVFEASHKRSYALYAYKKAVELKPNFTQAQLNLGYSYQKERMFDEAIALYKRMLLHDTKNAEVINQLAFAYEMKHMTKPAIATYQKAIRVDPKFKDTYYNLGTLYKKLGKTQLAAAQMKKLMDLEFQDIEQGGSSKETSTAPEAKILEFVDLFVMDDADNKAITATIAKED